ncbi:hypothetical protein B5X24_HaOG202770 [Helicoverpa armigera]|uniref:Uncharacterized protein n=1 Tax=Helicoverpa armigera TaxID=29058 RepID=A0A2W1BS43_HELAM|nr:hypothetical protein B5X24_HaOG202770 [Helicoverpa armigera]
MVVTLEDRDGVRNKRDVVDAAKVVWDDFVKTLNIVGDAVVLAFRDDTPATKKTTTVQAGVNLSARLITLTHVRAKLNSDLPVDPL